MKHPGVSPHAMPSRVVTTTQDQSGAVLWSTAVGLLLFMTLIPSCTVRDGTTLVSKDTQVALMKGSPNVAPGSRRYELFQQHCAACHGVRGDGSGAAAFALDVRPRDLWNEPIRYVSSTDGAPTYDDVLKSVRHGRVGGEMPAGPWLSDADAHDLATFVVEIQRLGWVGRLSAEFEGEEISDEELHAIATDRMTALDVVDVASPPLGFAPNLGVGAQLFADGCASCHGSTGRGDGVEQVLDELGRPISIRNLTDGRFRGGDDLDELFKRIRCGLPGTPMPAQTAWSDEQIWELVFYTLHLAGRDVPSADQ